jgi:hypothetical protein
MWVNPLTGSWMTADEDLPQRVRQTIGPTKSMLMLFFNPKEFAIVDLLPQDTSFIAVYFVNNVILPLANRYVQQLGMSAVARCICISTIRSAILLGMSKNRWPAIGASVFPTSGIHPTWPSQTSTYLADYSNSSRQDLGQ